MHRTTIALKEDLYQKLNRLAEADHRTTNNLIETILLRHLEEDLYADPFEMAEIRQDAGFRRAVLKGLSDYRARRGRYV